MELKINGQNIKLLDSMPAITRKSIDIDNPSSRFIDYSNNLKIPNSTEARKILESPTVIGSNSNGFDKTYRATLTDESIIFRGKAYLKEAVKDYFSVQLVDDSRKLFDAIEIKLNEINWDDKDTILTTSAIDALDTADLTTCWFWGKACLHKDALKINTDQTTGDARCKYSRPFFFLQGLLKRAVENAGYTVNFPNDYLAISSFHKDFYFTSYQKTLNGTYSPSGTLALSGLNSNDFAHSDITVASTTINIGVSETVFRLRGSVVSDNGISITIRATDNVDATKVKENKFTFSDSGNIDFETSEFQSDNGMTVDIFLEGTGDVTFTDTYLYTLISDDSKDLSTNPFLGYKIKAYDNLEDITYLDLFRTICVTSNRYHIVDNFNKILSFETLANLNKNNSVDWSNKYVKNSHTINAQLSRLGRINFLKYENDLTVNRQLGWATFETENENLKDESDYITLRYGASNDVTIDSNNIAHIRLYNDNTRIGDQDINIRLLSIDSDKVVFYPISWQNIKEQFYKNWFSSMKKVRVVTAEFNINKLDVLSWKENKLVYIDYFKTMFIVLEISNFIPRKKTTVKLLAYGR